MLNTDSNTVPFTTELLVRVVTEETTIQYYNYPVIQKMFSLEDLIQENILWFYKPMKSGEQRLAHYLKECTTQKHVINIIKSTCKQSIPELLRYNFAKNFPSSLNRTIKDDEDSSRSTEFIDMVRDEGESVEQQISIEDIYKAIEECSDMYLRAEQNLQELIKEHQAIIRDLLAGYKKSELQLKYQNFDTKFRHIQEIIRGLYYSQGTSVEAVLGIRK